ncbi:hypothetical protein N7486_002592 [Penicillium sp. IBT 16267x]|nr:hypothetical protein N7486_002592 [Penicillium sp. IBT 16267x]
MPACDSREKVRVKLNIPVRYDYGNKMNVTVTVRPEVNETSLKARNLDVIFSYQPQVAERIVPKYSTRQLWLRKYFKPVVFRRIGQSHYLMEPTKVSFASPPPPTPLIFPLYKGLAGELSCCYVLFHLREDHISLRTPLKGQVPIGY